MEPTAKAPSEWTLNPVVVLHQVFVNFAKDQSDEDHLKEVNLSKRDAVVVDVTQLMDSRTRESCV